MGILSPGHLLIILLIVVLIFGTKKLRNIGSDVGGAVKNFKDAMNEEKVSDSTSLSAIKSEATPNLIGAEVTEVPVPKAAPRKRAPAKSKVVSTAPATVTAAKKTTVKKTTVKKMATK